ncbi:MAG: cupin domain-containing protein [Caldilineaceae bacterium]
MAEQNQDVMRGVEHHEGLWWVRGGGENHRAWNGIRYKTGLSGKNVGAQNLSMNVATVPPGAIAYAHIHVGFEVMLFLLQGRVRHEYGPDLQYSVEHQAGDFIYIEPGVPHEVFNLSDTEPVVAVVARSAADEWDKIVNYPSKYREQAEAVAREAAPAT